VESKPNVSLQVLDAADQADVDFIFDGLRQYNEQFHAIGHRSLYVFLRDESGALVGGLLGDTYWGWLSINIVWIDKRFRGQGHGERLLAAAEEEGRRRECAHAQLDTLSFQARPFYEKLGYRVYGTLEDFPAGSDTKRYYMTKEL
jgi:ribosomal protein S18 acetylase RimI-like enzyme